MTLKLPYRDSLHACFLLSFRVFSGFLAAFVYLDYVGWGREEFGRKVQGVSVLVLVQSRGTTEFFRGIMSLDLSDC